MKLEIRQKRWFKRNILLNDDVEDSDAWVTHHNQPVLMAIYKDPETLAYRICLGVTLPSGVSDIKFSLLGNGPACSTARVSYSWPTLMFNVEGVFFTPLKEKKITSTHPVILALKSELENNRVNTNEKSRSYIELTLPKAVQTKAPTISQRAGWVE